MVDVTHQHDDGGGSDEGVEEASLQGQPAATGRHQNNVFSVNESS